MFRRLLRHFARGLLDNDLITRGDDLHSTMAGMVSVLLVSSAAIALSFLSKYDSVVYKWRRGVRPPEMQTLSVKLAAAMDDKALLIGGAMLVMALLVVIWWDALVLDERDEAVLSSLPLRPAVVLSAKALIAASAAGIAALAINALPSILFPVIVLLKTTAGFTVVVREIAAEMVASVAGCAFAYLSFAGIRTAAVFFRSDRRAGRTLPALQFVFVLGLLALLFSLPELANQTRLAIETGRGRALRLPWVWFVGLNEVLAGRATPTATALGATALRALVFAGGTALGLQLLLMTLRVHRGGPAAGSPRSVIARAMTNTASTLAPLLLADGRTRAAYLFTIRTITRNPRHRVYLAASLGLGLATSAAALGIAYNTGSPMVKSIGLAAQLNLIFFVVVGLRMAAAVPADIDAGWIHRFHANPTRERYLAGTRAAIFVAILLPLLIGLAPLYALAWGVYAALVHFAFGVVCALGLLEVVFTGYVRMPFVSSFIPGQTVLTPRLGLYALDYALFVYVTPTVEQLLIKRTGLLYAWLALTVIVIARLLKAQSARLRRDELPEFDHTSDRLQQLELWDAIPRPTSDLSVASSAPPPMELFATLHPAHSQQPRATKQWDRRKMRLGIRSIPTEFRLATRRLTAQPIFTGFAVIALALGIAVVTALYSVLYSTILKPLPVPDIDSLVNIYHATPFHGSRPIIAFSRPDYDDFERQQHAFSAVAAHAPFGEVVIADGIGIATRGELVSGHYFDVLGVHPLLGRLLQPDDGKPGANRVAVIDARTWQTRFDRSPTAVGRRLIIAGNAFEVVGVAPVGFHGVELPNLAPTAIWIPLVAAADLGIGVGATDREWRWLGVKGRLARGRTLADAQSELRVIGARLDRAYPIGVDLPAQFRSPPAVTRNWVAVAAADRLVTEQADPTIRRLSLLTTIGAGLVLLVACTNLSNLTLARSLSRRRDAAIRFALGASRWDVVREYVLEHGVVAVLGGLMAFVLLRLLILYGLDVSVRLGPWITVDAQPVLDRAAAFVGGAATALCFIVSGLLPALSLSGGASIVQIAGTTGRWRGRRWLIAAQVAVSVALVAIAGLCARQVAKTAAENSGISLDHLAFVSFDFNAQGWSQTRGARTADQVLERASTLPGVLSSAIISGLPLRGSGRAVNISSVEHSLTSGNDIATVVTQIAGTATLFQTLGIEMLAGRSFSSTDSASGTRVVVLSQTTARRLFGSADVIGHQIVRRGYGAGTNEAQSLKVIGIAADSRDQSGALIPALYVPLSQQYEAAIKLVARTSGDPTASIAALRTIPAEVDPALGVIDAGTGAQMAGTDNVVLEVMGALAGALGTAAMILAMLGLYGVLSFVVAQRTHEIGVRVAFGATGDRIARLIVGEGVRPVIEGLVIGFVIADLAEMIMSPTLRTPLPAVDGLMLMVLPLPFLAAAVLACYVPSRRAAAVDPAVALRRE